MIMKGTIAHGPSHKPATATNLTSPRPTACFFSQYPNTRPRAEAVQGKLSIESTPGRGAMLSVEFPVREVLAVQP